MGESVIARAELMHSHVQRLLAEGERHHANGDLERLKAVGVEMALVLANMRALRDEQLVGDLTASPKEEPKRRWWQFG